MFKRWASDAAVPNDPTPRNVLLDATEILDRYRAVGSDDLEADTPLSVSELCVDVEAGRFALTANGRACEVAIVFDTARQRYRIAILGVGRSLLCGRSDKSESLTSYFNRTQAFRVIPATAGLLLCTRTVLQTPPLLRSKLRRRFSGDHRKPCCDS